jgi:hypothetical protein
MLIQAMYREGVPEQKAIKEPDRPPGKPRTAKKEQAAIYRRPEKQPSRLYLRRRLSQTKLEGRALSSGQPLKYGKKGPAELRCIIMGGISDVKASI